MGFQLRFAKLKPANTQLARWHVTDPLATEREWLSPYNFVQNNPILRIDPDGALDTKYVDEDDNVLAETDDGNDETVIIKNENVSAFFDEIEGHSAAGGNMNDPAYNQGLIEDYGHLKKIDGEVGVIGGSGMLEWAGAGGIAGSVKSAVSGVKHAVKVYKMIKAAKAAKKAEAAAKAGSRILSMSAKQLQKKYLKHAADFGIKGNWNKAAASEFSSAINQHINSPGVKVIQGTYKNQPAIHYLNPKTGLNVISHPNGQFWSGWRLGSQQLQGVLKNGTLW